MEIQGVSYMIHIEWDHDVWSLFIQFARPSINIQKSPLLENSKLTKWKDLFSRVQVVKIHRTIPLAARIT